MERINSNKQAASAVAQSIQSMPPPRTTSPPQPTTTDEYNGFMSLSDQIYDSLNNMGNSIVLANKEVEDNLFLSIGTNDGCALPTYISRINADKQNITKLLNRLVSAGAQAINNINKNISDIKDQVHNEINDFIDNNNENYDYTQQLIEAQSNQIKQLEETITKLNQTITNLTEIIKPPHITVDHVEAARYLIDNTKNSAGKSVKGLDITVKNLSAILERYDKLKAINKQ